MNVVPSVVAESKTRDGRLLLVLAAVVTVVIWQVPYGPQVLYPFTLLATYAHEMGHGLTAMLMGAEFEALQMHADGSGLAHWRGDVGAFARALIAAGGLVGPSIAGAIVLVVSKKNQRAPTILVTLAVLMGLSAIIWARSLFALIFILGCAAAFVLLARVPKVAPFFVKLVGVQLCLAVFRDLDYMFAGNAVVDGVVGRSDSAAIAEALLLPYWFWGGVVAMFSFAVLAGGLYLALRSDRARPVISS